MFHHFCFRKILITIGILFLPKVRPGIVNVNSNETLFYPFSIKTGKFSGIRKNINDLYAKLCVRGVIKTITIKVFNLMLKTNETRLINWQETCKYKCRLGAGFCNNK